MKSLAVLFILAAFSQLSFADQPSLCGEVWGAAYNQDTIERPYRLSGFWIDQGGRSTPDIRVTFGNSPELVEIVEELGDLRKFAAFVCLDDYTIETRTYRRRPRQYATATKFRVWYKGERVH